MNGRPLKYQSWSPLKSTLRHSSCILESEAIETDAETSGRREIAMLNPSAPSSLTRPVFHEKQEPWYHSQQAPGHVPRHSVFILISFLTALTKCPIQTI